MLAPFNADQVASLNDFQGSGVAHPFTCANATDLPHRDDRGVLIATEQGWVCADCDYTQDWAHAHMTDRTWEQFRLPF